jgi:predicted RNA-binding protein YlxR (DUF448 family)
MPPRNEPATRTCIVTREALPTERLIRFVAAPDGAVVADLRSRLPGRGVWVTADATHVAAAEKKRLFARGLQADVTVEPGLADRVAALLREAALASLSLARKAGELVSGFAKVEAALRDAAPVAALFHATEAGGDGAAKLDGLARRHAERTGNPVPVIRIFGSWELDLAFGRTNVIHAALLAGPAGNNALNRVRALADYLGGDRAVGDALSSEGTSGSMSAGMQGNT